MNKESLTGLLYFSEFREAAQIMLDEKNKDYILISFNVDGFKYINHTYGYQKGDEFLKLVANFFCKKSDSCLLATREYADHFFMIVNYKKIEEFVIYFSEKTNKFIKNYSYRFNLAKIHINAGAYRIEDSDINISQACDKAELARMCIKGNYEKTVAVYSKDLQKNADLEMAVIPMFSRAVEDDRVLVYLQPKIEIDTKRLIGAEALVRILDEEGNIQPPAVIVPVLEKSGMIYQLDLVVAKKVYSLIKKWLNNGLKPVRISINLSRVDFMVNSFLDMVFEEFDKYEIPNKYIEFEVTETAFVDDIDNVIGRVEELRKKGYAISMDDFGNGYSSLNAVGMLPVDIIKFDRGFIKNSIKTEKGIYVITKMVELFELLGMEVICEGVETTEEEELVRSCGCRYVQGYIYDKPLTVEEFEKKYMKKDL